MFDQRKCYGDVTCEQTSSSLFMKYHAYFGIILMLTKQVESLSKNYYKVRWNYYKLRQLSLLQSAMDCYYKLRQLFYYKVRHGSSQIATGITKCNGFITNCEQIATVHGISVFIYGSTNSFYQSRILHQAFAFLQSAGNHKICRLRTVSDFLQRFYGRRPWRREPENF